MTVPMFRSRGGLRVVLGLLLLGQFAIAWALAATPDTAPRPPLSVAVVGDHNTAGMQNGVVWPTIMAQRTGWAVSNFALPNTGFAAYGMGQQTFANLIDRAEAAHPQVILLADGTADASVFNLEAIKIGAMDAINKITRTGAQAAVVGPIWYESPAPDPLRRVNAVIGAVAKDAGVLYLDALDPPLLTRDLMYPDLSGPTDQGQSVIADKIADWLRNEIAE
jgi:hypothetical protein